jgi:hypoxanthine phosphoribosyltransferase
MIHVRDKSFVPFLDQAVLERRIAELARQIDTDYADRQPLLVAVLTGAFVFAAELMKRLTVPCEIAFIRLASYEGTQSTGHVREVLGLKEEIKNRDVILIEDIVDTGHTMAQLLGQITERNPASVEIATLLHKPTATRIPLQLRYVGFAIENRFVVGYGLDYDGLGRNLPAIFQVSEA